MPVDVCVVGGGVAGLAVAARLAEAGLTVTVLEAAQQVGGRARDERIDGFVLSDGGHLLHTTWSALRQLVSPAGLALGGFAPGVRICAGGRRIRFGAAPTRPQQTFSALRMPISRSLNDGLFELRFDLERQAHRVTYYFAARRRIVMLTVFRKQRMNERHEANRAREAMARCIREGHTAEEDNE